jgi:hypothetical protein
VPHSQGLGSCSSPRTCAQVNVNVYKTVAPPRDAPRPGYSCFTQDALAFWRESAAAAPWLQAAREANPLAQSLELVVLRRDALVDTLLTHAAGHNAALSLSPLLAVLAALAQDLRADFVPALPRVFSHFAALVDTFVTNAAALQTVFRCAAELLRHLHRPLAERAPWVLGLTRGLRYHHAHHVRCLAAQVRCHVLHA